MNATDIGLLFGLLSFCYMLATPLAGRLVDKTVRVLSDSTDKIALPADENDNDNDNDTDNDNDNDDNIIIF